MKQVRDPSPVNVSFGVYSAVPARQQLQGRGAEQLVGQEIYFLHDVGQPDRELLPQEHKGGLLTGVS